MHMFCIDHVNEIKCPCVKCNINLINAPITNGNKGCCDKCTKNNTLKFLHVKEDTENIFLSFQDKYKYWKKLRYISNNDIETMTNYLKNNNSKQNWYLVLNGHCSDIIDYPIILNCDNAEYLSTLTDNTSILHFLVSCVKNICELITRRIFRHDILRYYSGITNNRDLYYIWKEQRMTSTYDIGISNINKICKICENDNNLCKYITIFCHQCGNYVHKSCSEIYEHKCYTCHSTRNSLTFLNEHCLFFRQKNIDAFI